MASKFYSLRFDRNGNPVVSSPRDKRRSPAPFRVGYMNQGTQETASGILSITFDPVVELTPPIASFFPLYWKDLTDYEKIHGKVIEMVGAGEPYGEIEYTITPTPDWYLADFDNMKWYGKGEPMTGTAPLNEHGSLDGYIQFIATNKMIPFDQDPPADFKTVSGVIYFMKG